MPIFSEDLEPDHVPESAVRLAGNTLVEAPELTVDLNATGADLPGGAAPLAELLQAGGLRWTLVNTPLSEHPDSLAGIAAGIADLLDLNLLDTRQHRTDQPCGDSWAATCDGVSDPRAQVLGEPSRAAFAESFLLIGAIGAALCVYATYLFAYGHYWKGMLAGFIFMVLDTVDGKLARCTITSSAEIQYRPEKAGKSRR